MGCVCCSLSSFVSIVLDAFERISLCTVCAMLVCCLLFTVSSMLLMGIGIGYNYCSVQTAVAAMDAAAKAAGAVRSGPSMPASGRRRGDESRQYPRADIGMGTGRMSPGMRSLNRAANRMRSLEEIGPNRGRRDHDNLMPSNNNTINDLIIQDLNSTLLSDLSGNLTTFNVALLDDPITNFTAFNKTNLYV